MQSVAFGLLASVVFLPSLTLGDVIYRNNFGSNTGDSGVKLSMDNANVGWNLLRSQNGGNVADASSVADARAGINYSVGRPTDLGNVNAPMSLSNNYGVAFMSNGTSASAVYTGLYYTDDYVINREIYSVDSFQWYGNASGENTTQRLALQINSAWYIAEASGSPATGNFGNFGTTATLFTVDPDTVNWYSLTASVGSPFSIGNSVVALPTTGNITAFGLYVDPTTTTTVVSRFDTFTVNATAVPEPSALLLLGSSAVLLWLRRRRA